MDRPNESDRPASDPAAAVAFDGGVASLMEMLPSAVFWKDADFAYRGCNQRFVDMTPFTAAADVIGCTDGDLGWSEEAVRGSRASDRAVLESGAGRLRVVEPRRGADGAITWLEICKMPMKGPDGAVIGIFGVLTDVTVQKEREQELMRVRDHLEMAIESMSSGIVHFDRDERLVFANARYREIYGIDADVVRPGRTYEEILEEHADRTRIPEGPQRDAWLEERLRQHRRCAPETTQELSGKTVLITDRRTADGGVVSLRADVTRMTEIERELREAKEAAESASLAKSNFLANMSHEIRTPMTAILGFTQVALESEPADEIKTALGTVERNANRLLHLIGDILDLSKVEAGKLEIDLRPTDLQALLGDTMELMAVRASEADVDLGFEFDGPLPERVTTDGERVRQVLINLLGNAIKFTRGGRVVVRVGVQGQGIEVQVVDSGIGMTPVQLERAFRPFEQADSSTTREYGGTGLGLTISRRLAELLGGSLSATSAQGQGSTFHFRFAAGAAGSRTFDRLERQPTGSTGTAPRDKVAPKPLAGVSVLLAEDGRDNQRLISHVLTKAGATVDVQGNGRLALGRALGLPPGSFDVVLMDMQMPELDGLAATRALREAGFRAPIIALTANAMAGDREACIEAGCDDYLAKPIDFGALVGACGRWGVLERRAA